ncbi:MAG TPA: hypothetical protein VF066_15950 [Thermoleophilaceae bacterium]
MSRVPRASFESLADQLAPSGRPGARSIAPGPAPRGLHICPGCHSKLVYPIAWEQCPSDRWCLTLRCPECELTDFGAFEERALEAFELELDRGEAELAADLCLVVEANMTDVVTRFVRALEADAIQPMDF